MIEKVIDYEGNQFIRGKKIQGKNHVYVEYRNNELNKIKFFEIHNGNRKDVTDKKDLEEAVINNYIVKEEI